MSITWREREKRKRDKQRRSRHRIKDNQKNVVRFIKIKYMVFKKINGKYKADELVVAKGLQVEHVCYLENGKRKMMNASRTRIIKKYKGIPAWATSELIDRYKQSVNLNTES